MPDQPAAQCPMRVMGWREHDLWTVVIVWDDGRVVLHSHRDDDGISHHIDLPPGAACTARDAEQALADLGWRRVDDWYRSGTTHAATVERIHAV